MCAGPVPSSLVHMPNLLFLYLSINRFTGNNILTFLPFAATDVDLSGNLFSGQVLFNASGYHLQDLYLRHNSFTGSLSTDLALIQGIINLDLGFNKFTGTIPTEMNSVRTLIFRSFIAACCSYCTCTDDEMKINYLIIFVCIAVYEAGGSGTLTKQFLR